MNFDHFVGQVQHRAQLPDTGSAVWAIQATLQSLAERIDAGEAKDLAAQLPRPFQIYFNVDEHGAPFSVHEFFERVSEREQVDVPVAAFHARVVLEVLQEAVSVGEWQDVVSQMPADWRQVFATGATGNLKLGKLKESRRARQVARVAQKPRSTMATLKAKVKVQPKSIRSVQGQRAVRSLAAKESD
jgi:uncharacterized protein (DUF2267 family)